MSNPVYEALDTYYDTQYVLDEEADDYDESAVIFDFGIPLENRESNILSQIEKLLEQGVDLNDAPDGNYPLVKAICNHDAPMTRFLIRHGANCRKWPVYDDEPDPEEVNWYLDALDTTALHESFVTEPNRRLFQAIFDISCILVKEGGLQEPFSGYCIKITKDREIIFNQAQVLF